MFTFKQLSILFAIALLFATSAFGAGNIGLNYSQVVDDVSTGVNAGYEIAGEKVSFEIDGDLQSGDIHRGKVHAELTFDVSKVGIKLMSDSTLKGYTLDTIGRDSNVFAALSVPIQALNVDVGIGGKSAAPWGAPNALSDLTANGYDEADLEGLGLGDISPAPRGLPFQSGTSLQAYVATGLKHSNVDIDLKGIIQLSGDDKAHQMIATFDTSKELFGNVSLNIGAELGLMSYQEALHSEVAIFTGLGINF